MIKGSPKPFAPPTRNRGVINPRKVENSVASQSIDSKASFNSGKQTPVDLMRDAFREMLICETRLEKAEIELSVMEDFNLIDAFRLFDEDGKGVVNAA